MQHKCHAYDCQTPVPPRMWGCRKHWAMVPKHLQRLLWSVYREGQEARKDATTDYRLVAGAVRNAVAAAEGRITWERAQTGVDRMAASVGLPTIGLQPEGIR
ncbi:MAG TPA: hypothetical protein VEI97_14805 [bacterium]|nr:hypothetical protein [bacterium]